MDGKAELAHVAIIPWDLYADSYPVDN